MGSFFNRVNRVTSTDGRSRLNLQEGSRPQPGASARHRWIALVESAAMRHTLSKIPTRHVRGASSSTMRSPQCAYFFTADLTACRRAWPLAVLPPTGQKPLMFSCLRQALTAAPHLAIILPFLLAAARAEAFLETTLPALFFLRSDFFRPPVVFTFLPENTEALAPH